MENSEQHIMKQALAEDIPGQLREVEHLLIRQTELARQGRLRDVETLAEQTNDLVQQMRNSGVFESAEFAHRRDRLERLYVNLCLGLGAERAKSAKELSQVRKGMKTVNIYRRNM